MTSCTGLHRLPETDSRSANGLCAYVTVGYHEPGVRWGLIRRFRATRSSKAAGSFHGL